MPFFDTGKTFITNTAKGYMMRRSFLHKGQHGDECSQTSRIFVDIGVHLDLIIPQILPPSWTV